MNASHPVLAGLLALTLAACGGGSRDPVLGALPPLSGDGVQRFASGPILTACTRQPRTKATRERCGCVQAAANLTLSADQQQQGVKFFENPEQLQKMKLSDSPANERFWSAWARFGETAESLCHGL